MSRTAVRGAVLLLVAIVAVACGGRSDADVEAAVAKVLANDPATARLKLSVEVRQGVAYLAGETGTRAEQERAVEIARSIEGVKDVTNAMRIADPLLVEAVKKALAADPLLASVPIEVDSRNGYVRLSSDQTDKEQRERALEVARKVDGVKQVEDRMK